MLISVLRMCFYFFVIYLEVPKFYLIFAHEYKIPKEHLPKVIILREYANCYHRCRSGRMLCCH